LISEELLPEKVSNATQGGGNLKPDSSNERGVKNNAERRSAAKKQSVERKGGGSNWYALDSMSLPCRKGKSKRAIRRRKERGEPKSKGKVGHLC